MASFRPLADAELVKLDDAELVVYAVRARTSGEVAAADRALQILVFGMEDALRAFVRNRLDSHGDTVIEEIAERALEDAIRSIRRLRGETAPQARAFVFRIARLRIADYHRRRRVEAVPIEPLAESGGAAATVDAGRLAVDGEADAVDFAIVLEQALAELRPDHRAAVEHFVIDGHPAEETVAAMRGRFDDGGGDSMTEQNVHQIASRFRRDLRARLEGAEG